VVSEPDPADRCIFILSPVKLPHGLPTPNFSKIADAALQAEAQLHWNNLEQALVAHNPYGIVNSAASMSEALLHAFLRSGNPKENLGEMLERLRKELDKNSSAFRHSVITSCKPFGLCTNPRNTLAELSQTVVPFDRGWGLRLPKA
jgi:hypothetical protein